MGQRTSYAAGTFSWVDIQTTDQDAAKAFYADLLGWEYEDLPAGEGIVYSMASVGGEHVAAISPAPAEIPAHWNSYVTVQSADDAAARAAALGATVLAEPFDVFTAGRMAALADPTGAAFLVWQPGDRIGAGRVNEPGCLSWNELATRDIYTAQDFYRNLFGWTYEDIDSDSGPYTVISNAGNMNGGVRALTAEEADVPPHWLPYFAVEDTDAAAARVTELGGALLYGPVDLPMGGRIAVAADAEGASFGVWAGMPAD
jgi:predicted enzyme related to lactoylglutathione lyase